MADTKFDTFSANRKDSYKRIIVCSDGTWLNALGDQGTWPPSNVTRISRAIKKTCNDGTNQVIYYHAGVGSSGGALDSLTGGDFGFGLDENIREIYNFIVANFVDGDDIILIGFSRGAFTARSVADMIATIGIMTHDGLDRFYSVFEDYENLGSKTRKPEEFLFKELAPYEDQTGKDLILWEDERKHQYREWLDRMGYTRTTFKDGSKDITIKAVAVWDTVGNLGIPPAPVFGIKGSAKQWAFTNTHVSRRVENAFQALALDEPRAAFQPALWERIHDNSTNLKQVWFPGDHSNVGGGLYDQQIANITLAWMCDQLSTIGVEFQTEALTKIFMRGLEFSAGHPFPYVPTSTLDKLQSLQLSHLKLLPWAHNDVFLTADAELQRDKAYYDGHPELPTGTPEQLWETARPWALGQTCYPTSWLQKTMGTTVRHPGLYKRVDPETNGTTEEPLLATNERIHSSVRVRLACGGLGTDDKETWTCESLTRDSKGHQLWRLDRGPGFDPEATASMAEYVPLELRMQSPDYPEANLYPVQPGDSEWRWSYMQHVNTSKDGYQTPQYIALPEEPLTGYFERLLLALTRGKNDVWRYAQENPPLSVMGGQ